VLPKLFLVSFVESCEPPINGKIIRGLERETEFVFGAKTSAKFTVELKQFLHVAVYQLDFAMINDMGNIITNMGTGVSDSDTFDYTSANTNVFWVSWKNNVIAMGAGEFPGENEIIRLTDVNMGNGKPISIAGITTSDADARFMIFRGWCIQ